MALFQLAQRSRLHKSTALRLLASLERSGFASRQADGRYRLGASIARLHAAYLQSFSLESIVLPAMQSLTERTGECSEYHVRQVDHRVCLFRVDSAHPLRDGTKPGDVLPLDRGAGGRVLLAFAHAGGPLYARIRRERIAILKGDRFAGLTAIAAPAFDADGQVAGAVTLSMPAERFDRLHASTVVEVARRITQRLGGEFPTATSDGADRAQ